MSAHTNTNSKPWLWKKGYRPPHTGKPITELRRLGILIGHRKRTIKLLDINYVERRAQLVSELNAAEARRVKIREAEILNNKRLSESVEES